jgi:hypothetical protein
MSQKLGSWASIEGINDLSRDCGPSGFLDTISSYFDVYTRKYYYLERGLERSLQLLTGSIQEEKT